MTPQQTLDRLQEDGIFDAVIQRLKTGKEAEVFIVRKGEDYFAAKLYKERHARNFKNNSGYVEGREVRNSRDRRAMAKGTKYGQKRAEEDWKATEHDALFVLLNAGVRVPKPELFYEGVLIMELVLGPDGTPAPRLMDVPFTAEEAIAAHRDVIGGVVRMLTCDLIHGDLSPYNILMAWNGPVIIDLPQAVKAAHNSRAEEFLVRDVRNVTEFFARFAPQLRKRLMDGHRIWKRYMKRDLTPDYFPEESETVQVEYVPPPRAENGPAKAGPRPERSGHERRPERRPDRRPEGRAENRGDNRRAGGRPEGQRQGEHPQAREGGRPERVPRPSGAPKGASGGAPSGERPARTQRPAARGDRPSGGGGERPQTGRPFSTRHRGRRQGPPRAET